MKKVLITALLTICSVGIAQMLNQNSIISLWAVKEKYRNTNGLSVGIIELSGYESDTIVKPKKVNGVRLELIGAGLLLPLIPHSPINDTLDLQLEKKKANRKSAYDYQWIKYFGLWFNFRISN